eukprot:5530620-Prymnesium_polylepis.1
MVHLARVGAGAKPFMTRAMAVTALAMDDKHDVLFSGDESGGVCTWELGVLLDTLEGERRQHAADDGSDGSEGSTSARGSPFESAGSAPPSPCALSLDASLDERLDGSAPRLSRLGACASASAHEHEERLPVCSGCWCAHAGSVHSLAVVEALHLGRSLLGACLLLSASRDGTLCAWAIDAGTPEGVEQRGPGADKIGQLVVSRCEQMASMEGVPPSLLEVYQHGRRGEEEEEARAAVAEAGKGSRLSMRRRTAMFHAMQEVRKPSMVDA